MMVMNSLRPLLPKYYKTEADTFTLFFKKKLFIRERHTEREAEKGRDTGRGRSRLSAGSLMQDLIPEPQDHDLS